MLKPSEKMLAQLAENDEPIDYSIDSIPLDFSNQSQYSDHDLEQLFSEDSTRTLYIYKINKTAQSARIPAKSQIYLITLASGLSANKFTFI